MTIALVSMYLTAIIAANLSIAYFGPSMAIINALMLISLDLTSRDRLHELWHHDRLWLRMGALIAAGSVLSYALEASAGRIALASFVSFAVSETADALVYSRLARRSWFAKVNGSNVASAALDSVIFPTLAFGAFLPVIVLGQFLAKVGGGAAWAYVLGLWRERRTA